MFILILFYLVHEKTRFKLQLIFGFGLIFEAVFIYRFIMVPKVFFGYFRLKLIEMNF